MKILAFTDVHADQGMLHKLLKKAKDADILVCAGDLSLFGTGLEGSINFLRKTKKQILIIHGNHETEEDINHLCKRHKDVINIHKKPFKFNDHLFVGYGGGGFAIYDFKLEIYFKLFKKKYPNENVVMVVHQPPAKTKLDIIPVLGHRGSVSINRSIRVVKPKLFICGHFHETFGKRDKIGKTILINPSCDGRIIEV